MSSASQVIEKDRADGMVNGDIEDKRQFVTSILASLEEGSGSRSSPKETPPLSKESAATTTIPLAKKEDHDFPVQPEPAKPTAQPAVVPLARKITADHKGVVDTQRPHILPADFEPCAAHVLCGRRKGHKDFGGNWPGNMALQEMIRLSLDEYVGARYNKKIERDIISSIVSRVRRGGGGFVRISTVVDDDQKHQQKWMDVGDKNARKDVSAIFRLFVQAQCSQMLGISIQKTPSRLSVYCSRYDGNPIVDPVQTGFTMPNVPTKLVAVEDAKRHGLEYEEDKSTRRRSTASIENGRTPATQRMAKILERELQANSRTVPARSMAEKEKEVHSSTQHRTMSMHNNVGLQAPLGATHVDSQAGRPKKRRSVDENIAADALQMIAHAASNSDDETTVNRPHAIKLQHATFKSPSSQSAPSRESEKKAADVRVCCLQVDPRRANETPWDSANRVLACMASVAESEQGIDIFILPELCPFGSNLETFTKYLPLSDDWQSLYKQIDDGFRNQARTLGAYIVYGMIGWHYREPDRSLRFTVQHKVVDKQGSIVAVYDKCHLSDLELKFVEAGPRRAATFSINGFNFGLVVGDDMKYPGLSRSLARDEGVDVLVHPAAETTPRYIRHCRAIENAVYVLGVEGTSGSVIAVPPDPDHEPVCTNTRDTQEAYLLTRIEKEALNYARTNFAYYRVMMTEPREKL